MIVRPLFALGAMLALAACETANRQGFSEMYPLLDSTGRVVAYAPPSAAQNTPPGTAIRMNINGSDQLVTLGPRISPATSAGTPVVIGTDNGRPIVAHIGQAQGDLAPSGTPYVTGTGADGRPVITYVQPGQQAPQGAVAGRRGARNVAPRAPGDLQPGVSPVIEQNR